MTGVAARPILFNYGTLDPAPGQDDFVATASRQLVRLFSRPPLCGRVEAHPITDADFALLRQAMTEKDRPITESVADFSFAWHDRYQTFPRLIVGTSESSSVAVRCRETQPHALWGLAVNEMIAIVYGPQRHGLVWHEAMHLLGAEDCYDPSAPSDGDVPTCGLANCLMQYAAPDVMEEDWPFLCKANTERVRERLENLGCSAVRSTDAEEQR